MVGKPEIGESCVLALLECSLDPYQSYQNECLAQISGVFVEVSRAL